MPANLKQPLLSSVDLEEIVDAVAERLADKLVERLPATSTSADEPLLLTVEQVAAKLGRTVAAVQHLIRERRLPTVRFDRRISVDYRDILVLVEQHKKN